MQKTQELRPKKYTINFHFNGGVFTKRNASVKDAILQVAPELLHTEMYVTVKNGKDVTERKLTLIDGRKLFRDETFLDIFTNNLLLNGK